MLIEGKRKEKKREREKETKDDHERELHRSMCQCVYMSEPARSLYAPCATLCG